MQYILIITVDGQWTSWGSWGLCSVTCENGIETRYRTCTNPSPQYGGQSCTGDDTETQACSLPNCPSKLQNNSLISYFFHKPM